MPMRNLIGKTFDVSKALTEYPALRSSVESLKKMIAHHNALKERMIVLSAPVEPIDWNKYSTRITSVGVVDNAKKNYEKFKYVRDVNTRVDELKRSLETELKSYNDEEKLTRERLVKVKKHYDLLNKIKPYEEMSFDELIDSEPGFRKFSEEKIRNGEYFVSRVDNFAELEARLKKLLEQTPEKARQEWNNMTDEQRTCYFKDKVDVL